MLSCMSSAYVHWYFVATAEFSFNSYHMLSTALKSLNLDLEKEFCWAVSVVQLVVSLPRMYQALGSIPRHGGS